MVNDKTPGGAEVVLTDATLYYDIPAGYQVLITSAYLNLLTASDSVHGDLVSCDAVTGGGAPTALCGHMHIFSSGNLAGTENDYRQYLVPILVKYSDGARSISMRVDANDAAAVITCGWMGWLEAEEE